MPLTYPKKHAYFNWTEIVYKPIFLGNSNASPNTGFNLRRDGKSTNLTIFPVVTWQLPFILWGPRQVSSLLGGLPIPLHPTTYRQPISILAASVSLYHNWPFCLPRRYKYVEIKDLALGSRTVTNGRWMFGQKDRWGVWQWLNSWLLGH